MMNVLDYTTAVQQAVRSVNASGDSIQWFSDRGKASRAVGLALEGKHSEALKISEQLAETYQEISR